MGRRHDRERRARERWIPREGEWVEFVGGFRAGQAATVEQVDYSEILGKYYVRLIVDDFPWPLYEPLHALRPAEGA